MTREKTKTFGNRPIKRDWHGRLKRGTGRMLKSGNPTGLNGSRKNAGRKPKKASYHGKYVTPWKVDTLPKPVKTYYSTYWMVFAFSLGVAIGVVLMVLPGRSYADQIYTLQRPAPEAANCVDFLNWLGYNIPKNGYYWVHDHEVFGTPSVGDVLVWDYGAEAEPYTFHVAVVVQVNSTGEFVLEGNWEPGKIDVRFVPNDSPWQSGYLPKSLVKA